MQRFIVIISAIVIFCGLTLLFNMSKIGEVIGKNDRTIRTFREYKQHIKRTRRQVKEDKVLHE